MINMKRFIPCIHPLLCLVLMFLITSCGRRPPPSTVTGTDVLPASVSSNLESLRQHTLTLEAQLSAEREEHRKTEQRLALEQSWRGRWQTLTFVCALGAVITLFVGMALGSQTRKEAETPREETP